MAVPLQPDLDRFLALVRRELGADEVRLVHPDEEAVGEPGHGHELRCPVEGGRWLSALFAAAPEDQEARQRRLEMLASTFDFDRARSPVRRSRPPLARSLQDELDALRVHTAAVNVFVIDANSPIVWGAARPAGVVAGAGSEPPPDEGADGDSGHGANADRAVIVASRRALHDVRSLDELGALHKGRHVRHVINAGEVPLLARSFAGIYLVVLVFDAPFDELRAERALGESLGRIERLVLALPPLNPPPTHGAGVVAMRRPRRR